ncbi:hypothetical protein LXL04_020365 [Taraxacum kok-saghyz]
MRKERSQRSDRRRPDFRRREALWVKGACVQSSDSMKGNSERLKFFMTGEVKNVTALATILTNVKGLGNGMLKVDYMGGLWVLISSNEGGEVDPNLLRSIEPWFRILKPWEEGFTVEERVTWVSIGLPIEAWNTENLNIIACKWGEPIFTQGCTLGGKNASKGNVYIKTIQSNVLTCTCNVVFGGTEISIRIIENGGLDLENLDTAMNGTKRQEKEEGESDDDDDVEWDDRLSKSSDE